MKAGFYSLLNILLFIFWFRIWVEDSSDTFFNRYLRPISRISDKITDFLSPAFFGAPQRLIAIISFVFLVVLRGMAVTSQSELTVIIGFERGVNSSELFTCIVFSLLSFLVFLFKLYCISILYIRAEGTSDRHTTGALFHLSRPFTEIKPELRPIALLIIGMAIVGLADIFGADVFSPEIISYYVDCELDWTNTNTILPLLTKLFLITLIGWVQTLGLLAQIVLFLVIISWVTMVANSGQVGVFAKEWLSFLLGPLRKHPIMIGNIDLSPLIFIVVVTFIGSTLMQLLKNSLAQL